MRHKPRDDHYRRMWWTFMLIMGLPSLVWTGINAYQQYRLWVQAQELHKRVEAVASMERTAIKTFKGLLNDEGPTRKEGKKHGR